MPQALFAKRGSRKLDAVGGQHVVVVERLASFVASVFDATRFLKNAWRPFRRLFVRRLGFVVALRRKSQPRGLRRCFVSRKKMRFKIK